MQNDLGPVEQAQSILSGKTAAASFASWFVTHLGESLFASGANIGIGNLALVWATPLTAPIIVRKISFTVATAQPASHIYVAIYDANGNLVPNSSTGGVITTAIGVKSVTLATPVALAPGLYYVLVAGDVAGLNLDGSGWAGTTNTLMNTNKVRIGTPANGIVGSAVPATLGVITAFNAGLPLVLFES